ncbi:MAG: hypothetical protein KDD37_09645 [Bdellovibrionales bacterium]|nr:hypothetical protein [Bdellovibrionales bacterium]
MFLFSILLYFYANAGTGKCTEWAQDTVQYCTYEGATARVWNRTCFNKNDLETFCGPENPNSMKEDCTEWTQKREKCSLANGRFGDLWERHCKTLNDKTRICMTTDPNTIK